ncbi:MAG: sugar phosphate nucleotidyltransferase [Bacteroides sp.]|nr:sugar phosphate nucleotidyltransferase [Bacteroides sp.]MCM1084950.1 sugar phosphate nucleotidyltransferase [Bacteroides sp.]
MIAFILAAGLGTRLRPLTDARPKALVEYQGKPLLEHLLERLQAFGCRDFVLNLHHFPDMLREFAAGYAGKHGLNIAFSDETGLLLETGGALTHALPLFTGQDRVLVHNVDIRTDLDIDSLRQEMIRRDADAVLSVRRRDTSRYLYADGVGRLRAWKNLKSGQVKGEPIREGLTPFAFSGIHLLKTELVAEWAERYGTDTPFSVIDAYMESMRSKNIVLLEQTGGYWKDMGKISDFYAPL